MEGKKQNNSIDVSGRVISSEEMPKLDPISGEMQPPEKSDEQHHVFSHIGSSMHAHGEKEADKDSTSGRMLNNTGGDRYNNQQTDADAATS